MEYPYRKCAAAVLFNDSGRVLVCARNDLQHDDWQFPQGGVEAGETAVDAARRELMKKRRSGRFSLLRPWKKACVILFPTSFWRKEKTRNLQSGSGFVLEPVPFCRRRI